MRNFQVLLVLCVVACADTATGPSSPSIPSFPAGSDTVVPPPPPPPAPASKNNPIGASRNPSWPENGPQGFHFVTNNWGIAPVDSTAYRYGTSSEKFTVTTGECFGGDCYRTPVFERKEYGESDEGLAKEGDDIWYGWSFYVPVESIQTWTFFGQIMEPPAPSSTTHEPLWMFFKRHNQPFCMVFDFNRNPDPWSCYSTGNTNNNINLISNMEFAGKWHDIVLHIKFSATNGLTEVWVDDIYKGKYTGYTLLPERRGAVMKYGIYRTATQMPSTTIVYYDELRKGKTRAEVDIRILTDGK